MEPNIVLERVRIFRDKLANHLRNLDEATVALNAQCGVLSFIDSAQKRVNELLEESRVLEAEQLEMQLDLAEEVERIRKCGDR